MDDVAKVDDVRTEMKYRKQTCHTHKESHERGRPHLGPIVTIERSFIREQIRDRKLTLQANFIIMIHHLPHRGFPPGVSHAQFTTQHCKNFACASRARPYDRFCVYRAICALNTKIAKTHCAQSVKCALRAIRKAAHSAVYAFWPKQHCAQCAKRL